MDGATPPPPDDREDALVQGLLSGVAVFRWLAWGWLAVVLLLSRTELADPDARPWVAYGLAGLALAVTVAATVLLRRRPAALLEPRAVVGELAVAFALMVGDQLAYPDVDHPQWLGSAWPLAGIITAGMAFGRRGGLLAGVAVGLGRILAHLLDPTFAWDEGGELVSAVSTVVLYALAGGTVGFVMAKLRDAERRIGSAQAREEVARTLHDGVLQTLAVVQRRSTDDDITRLAHNQERELREFLFGSPSAIGGGGDLGTRLRSAAAMFEDRFEAKARVVTAPDLPELPPESAEALVGAVTEALTNAGKHSHAASTTIYVEPLGEQGDQAVFCSVKDDGVGFDSETTAEGVGVRRSIKGRIAEVGGRVEIDGRPGRGTEVRCWIPCA
jgi:signal transduction histidine kinase